MKLDGAHFWGWDDESVYFTDSDSNTQHCVTDEPELMKTIIQACRDYFLERTQTTK